MAETFAKKEKEKKKAKKKQDREQKREDRKFNNDKGKSLDEMTVYVDEEGNFHDSPPDFKPRKKIDLNSLRLLVHFYRPFKDFYKDLWIFIENLHYLKPLKNQIRWRHAM